MSETRAIPTELLTLANPDSPDGLPLCPSCLTGYLQPYRVTIGLRSRGAGGFDGADWLEGWAAVCQGNQPYIDHLKRTLRDIGELEETERAVIPACGFTMPMTAGQLVTGVGGHTAVVVHDPPVHGGVTA